MAPRTRYSPSKSYANYTDHPSLGQKRFNAALNLLNSYLNQPSLRNRCIMFTTVGVVYTRVYTGAGG